jgi:transcription antitermination factor NusG
MSNDLKWYALAAWNNQVMDVRAELVGLGVLSYVPCETVERRVGRKVLPVRRPVWPGYLFVHCAPEDFGAVMDVDGVYDFVRESTERRRPVALGPNDLAPVVLAELFGDLDYTRREKEYKPQRGQRVKVKSGKWKGYFGSILSVAKRKSLVETQWCKLEIEAEHLQLDAEQKAA